MGFFLIFVNFENNFSPKIEVPNIATDEAKNFAKNAEKQIGIVTKYDFLNGYYGNGGFPPDDTGVCSDVIWRAFREENIDFKAKIDEHMKKFPHLYASNFDSNINFRRVKNIDIYLQNTAKSLTTEILPWNRENLAEWQVGDIVLFDALPPKNLWHIGIISEKRRADGVPYMIDNHGNGVEIIFTPLDWPTKIVGHYRMFE